MSQPLISIAMASYNGEAYIEQQLDSIYSQTYKNIEVIVSDDGSTDATVEILQRYKKTKGLRYYTNQENLGFKKNFEKAIGYCQGTYIALCDQDDIWSSNKLQILADNIGCYDLICSNMTLIDGNGNVLKDSLIPEISLKEQEDIFTYLMFGNFVTGCTVLMRKSLYDEHTPIPETEMYHDWWFATCATQNKGVKFINEALVHYRQHDKQDTGVGGGVTRNKFVYTLSMIFSRLLGKENERVVFARMQKKRLQGMLDSNCFEHKTGILRNAYLYFDDYYRSFFHLKSFLISFKYANVRYRKNYLFYKNFKNDLLG